MIVWQYKLSKDTINLPPGDGITEIQAFKITLKIPEFSRAVLKVIDKAVPYPIFYRLMYKDRINRAVAYKRVSGNSADNCVVEDYFEAGRTDAVASEIPLPVALETKVAREKQFKKKVDINAHIRDIDGELALLSD